MVQKACGTFKRILCTSAFHAGSLPTLVWALTSSHGFPCRRSLGSGPADFGQACGKLPLRCFFWLSMGPKAPPRPSMVRGLALPASSRLPCIDDRRSLTTSAPEESSRSTVPGSAALLRPFGGQATVPARFIVGVDIVRITPSVGVLAVRITISWESQAADPIRGPPDSVRVIISLTAVKPPDDDIVRDILSLSWLEVIRKYAGLDFLRPNASELLGLKHLRMSEAAHMFWPASGCLAIQEFASPWISTSSLIFTSWSQSRVRRSMWSCRETALAGSDGSSNAAAVAKICAGFRPPTVPLSAGRSNAPSSLCGSFTEDALLTRVGLSSTWEAALRHT
mmetsp:Transcript_65449/g.142715  ORF Transcript_65449/g.142715 Transcript_65449/m.142715 type:complete len:337 (-) Transcript_65449:402-1412(-)